MTHLVLSFATLMFATSAADEAYLPTTLDLTRIRAIPVQHDGRWPPLDTVARDTVESIVGDAFFLGRDPVLTLLSWTFDAGRAMQQPLIAIKNAELREELRLPASRTTFSYTELGAHKYLHLLVDELSSREKGGKLDPLESKVKGIHQKMLLMQQVFHGQVIRPIPAVGEFTAAWTPIGVAATRGSGGTEAATAAWSALRTAFLADDAAAFSSAATQLASALEALPAAYRPGAKIIATELHYNELRPFRLAWQVMVVGAVLALIAVLVRRKWLDGLTFVVMIAGFAVLTYGLSLRWQIAGRIPASNMFESLLFVSWGTGAFAVLSALFLGQRAVPLTATALGALSLILADCLPVDHFIRPTAPVLMDTVWMSIHVPIIMTSYSVLTLAVLIAHVQLVVIATAPRRQRLIGLIDSMHYWYVHVGSTLLLAGIVTGSMWAASSWGRYWGWDPKEVWSLVAFLGYVTILHVRLDHGVVPRWAHALGIVLGVALFALLILKLAPPTPLKLVALAGAAGAVVVFVTARSQFATAMKSILAFWLIIMTYVGVNYVLGVGLHSYGFGTGAVAHYMFLAGGIDLALVAVFGLICLARRSSQPHTAHA